MSKLNKDVLFLIFEELNDEHSLYSSILVNTKWCEVCIPILWRDPWRNLHKNSKERSLLETVVSFLTNKARDSMIARGLNLLIKPDKPPLFNYIRFCRHLNLNKLSKIIYTIRNIREESKWSIIRNEIFKLFINENNRFTHLHIPPGFKHQIQLLPGFDRCFSELESLRCDVNIDQSCSGRLAEVCKSIKKLNINVRAINNHGIIRLIEAQTNLKDVRFVFDITYQRLDDSSFYRICGKALIKHANTIRCLQVNNELIPNPSSFVNLTSLEIGANRYGVPWNNLENTSLPALRKFKAHKVPSNLLAHFIENNKRNLVEIKISGLSFESFESFTDSQQRLIQAIYRNCPNLQYLELIINSDDFLELEELLINCQHLDGLILNIFDFDGEVEMDWFKLFEIITNSAPENLFKFKFIHRTTIRFNALKAFFDNWNRHPMLLHFIEMFHLSSKHLYLIDEYKKRGVVKSFYHDKFSHSFKDFEWIKKR